MSIEALGTLAANVFLKMEKEPDVLRKRGLLALHARLLDEIAERCRAKAVATTGRSSPSRHENQPEACTG